MYVPICFCRQGTSYITWLIACIFITTYNKCNEFYVGKSGRAITVIVQAAYTNMHMYSPNTYVGTSNWGKIISEVHFYAFAFSLNRHLTQVQSVCKYFFSYFKIFLSHYQIFKSYFFLPLTFTIWLSDFTIELLIKNLITKQEKFMTKKI